MVRHGIVQLIDAENDMSVCGQATTTDEALERLPEADADLVIVDISLPGGNGLELVEQVVAAYPRIKVLVSTGHDEQLFAEQALRAGARGYLSKNEDVANVPEAIRQVMAGKLYLSNRMADRLLHRVFNDDADLQHSPIDGLSERERQVFELLGEGRSTREIAETLGLSVKTIETYREKVKTKLNVGNGAELVRRAVQWTLQREDETESEAGAV